MSPARQTNRSPGEGKSPRQVLIDPTLQTAPNAIGPSLVAKKKRDFDPHAFLATIGEGRKSVLFRQKQGIFAQGDAADAVFYIQTGKVKLTVVSKTGKEATIGILTDGRLFRRRFTCGPAASHVLCNRYDGLRYFANRQESHDGSASSGARVFRPVRGLFVSAEHPLRRRPG